MAKKADLLIKAKELGIEVSDKNTVAEIAAAIKNNTASTVNDNKNSASNYDKVQQQKVAKAGKHSAKGIKKEQSKQEKIERQKHREEAEETAKPIKTQQPIRTRLERKGKKYREAAKIIDKTQEYSIIEAINLAQQSSTVKFDASVELHIRLGVDPKQADQNIRDSIILPAGSGKVVRVAVYGDDEEVKKAKAAGADIAGSDDFLAQLDKGDLDFDVLISTPKLMRNLSKHAKVLGPRGLMPNPKSGTVTSDVAKAVKESKGGKVEYRVDSAGIIHLSVGKVSFDQKDLEKNILAVMQSVKTAKPSSLKSNYVISIHLTTSMGPSIKITSSAL